MNQKTHALNPTKIIVLIDSSSNQKIQVSLQIGKVEHKLESSRTSGRGSQVILPMINNLLIQNKLTIHSISAVKVRIGPGSFTGLRVGVSIANTLAYILNVPINNKKSGIVTPVYE